MKYHQILYILFISLCALPLASIAQQDKALQENEYYRITDVPIPEGVILEAGGLAFTDDDRLGVCTRRGEIWVIDDPYMKISGQPKFTRFASGLHEPLGLAYRNGSFYSSQRSELTKITDSDNDGKADIFKTIYSWPLSGNYHEYSYGPLFTPEGDMLVTLNLAWVGHGASLAKWRGWLIKITEDGKMTPIATGLRSPAGYNFNAEGDLFYAENQGDWIGSGRITHLEKGDFAGNPAGLRWTEEPGSPLKLKAEMIPDSVGLMHEFARNISSVKPPAVWFPHTIMGISTSDIAPIPTDKFGPFKGQLLVGDQGHSKIMRVFLEKVNGAYQGACFPFREGFSSGILRTIWGSDGSLFVGMTSRGWDATGPEPFGLQRLTWTGKTPFEIKAMRALSNGFELEFTQPVDKKVAANTGSYQMTGFIYSYHRSYGSPAINQQACPVLKAEVSEDGRKVRLYVKGLREGYVHELKAEGVKSQNGNPLLHSTAYYTLNYLPEGGEHEDHNLMLAEQDQQNADDARSCGSDPSKNITSMPSDWENGPDMVINIGTKPGLKFDLPEFEVPEGTKVQLVFNNSDDMLHNLVVVKPNTAEKVGKMAMELGIEGTQLAYIPDAEDVLYHTCLLQPETSQSIYFVAPKAGDYTYVCTFPGHYMSMQGTMKVIRRSSASR